MTAVEGRLAPDAFVVMDDIQDNLFFRDWTDARGRAAVVLGTGSYFVGAAGVPAPAAPVNRDNSDT